VGRDGGDGGNIFEGVPEGPLPDELLTELLVAPGLRIARIVSTGQASPPGSWYDQDRAEWVLVLAGSAGLLLEGEDRPRVLGPGDHLLIPAGARHRVEWTDPGRPTVWLAVHYG
jgi:cupin 2 domain-containing protein